MESIQEIYEQDKFCDELKYLRQMIIDIKTQKEVKNKDHETSDLKQLYEALIKTQMEMESAKTDSTNPHFKSKYADFKSVIVATRPYLLKNGLLVFQQIITEKNDKDYLYTRLSHISGQYIESKMLLNTPNNNPQEKGKFITYFKRYAYASLIGVITEDDDCKSNVEYQQQKKETISKTQLATLSNELIDQQQLASIILKEYKINKLSDLLEIKYDECLSRVKAFKMKKSIKTA